MMQCLKNRRGTTLVELIVCMVLLRSLRWQQLC